MKTPQNQTTTLQKMADIDRQWHKIDVNGQILGQAATKIAVKLMGKHKPTYTPHVDNGDYVVVTNAAGIEVTRNKAQDKVYFSYSGYPGGLSKKTFAQLQATHPERIIEKAVFNMLPDNRLRRERMKRLKVYAGSEHPHQAQFGEVQTEEK